MRTEMSVKVWTEEIGGRCGVNGRCDTPSRSGSNLAVGVAPQYLVMMSMQTSPTSARADPFPQIQRLHG